MDSGGTPNPERGAAAREPGNTPRPSSTHPPHPRGDARVCVWPDVSVTFRRSPRGGSGRATPHRARAPSRWAPSRRPRASPMLARPRPVGGGSPGALPRRGEATAPGSNFRRRGFVRSRPPRQVWVAPRSRSRVRARRRRRGRWRRRRGRRGATRCTRRIPSGGRIPGTDVRNPTRSGDDGASRDADASAPRTTPGPPGPARANAPRPRENRRRYRRYRRYRRRRPRRDPRVPVSPRQDGGSEFSRLFAPRASLLSVPRLRLVPLPRERRRASFERDPLVFVSSSPRLSVGAFLRQATLGGCGDALRLRPRLRRRRRLRERRRRGGFRRASTRRRPPRRRRRRRRRVPPPPSPSPPSPPRDFAPRLRGGDDDVRRLAPVYEIRAARPRRPAARRDASSMAAACSRAVASDRSRASRNARSIASMSASALLVSVVSRRTSSRHARAARSAAAASSDEEGETTRDGPVGIRTVASLSQPRGRRLGAIPRRRSRSARETASRADRISSRARVSASSAAMASSAKRTLSASRSSMSAAVRAAAAAAARASSERASRDSRSWSRSRASFRPRRRRRRRRGDAGGARGDSAAAGADERAELLELVLEAGATRALGVEPGRALGVHARAGGSRRGASRDPTRAPRGRRGASASVDAAKAFASASEAASEAAAADAAAAAAAAVCVRLVRCPTRYGETVGDGASSCGWACGVETHTLRTTRTIAAHLRAHAIHRRRDRAARRGRGKVCSEGPTSDLKRAPTAERFDLRSYLLNLPLDPPKSAN